MERAYFAGGEPLITDEHYMMLTRMIEAGRTDIKLIYNSNASLLHFKHYDLMDLWSKFQYPIEFNASVDHFGHKAEYIRHGTKWSDTEKMLRTIKQSDFVQYGLATTITNLNYPSLYEFVEYMLDRGLWPDSDWQMHPAWNPSYLSPQALPESIKAPSTDKLEKLLNGLLKQIDNKTLDIDYDGVKRMLSITKMVNDQNTWDHNAGNFKSEMFRLDTIRGENFRETFPELAEMVL
jgi:MoaA/NifB/PqqE/SkfB family radical SAM enzyme